MSALTTTTEKASKTKGRTVLEVGRDEPGVQDFLDSRRSQKRGSHDTYRRAFGMIRNRSPVPLLKLDERGVRALSVELKKMRGAQFLCAVTRMFFKHHGREQFNRFLVTPPRSGTVQPEDIPSDAEVQALINAAGTLKDRAMIGALFECGVRISELLAVRLKDVRIEPSPENGGKKLVVVWFRKSKVEGEQHGFTLVDSAELVAAWIEKYPLPRKGGEAPLFPSSAVQNYAAFMDVSGARRRLKDIALKAGLSPDRVAKIHPHVARHYAATRALRQGVPEAMVKKLFGWKPSSTMLSKYSHLLSQDAQDAYLQARGLKAAGPSQVQPFTVPAGDVPAMAAGPERYVDAGQVARLTDEVQAMRRIVEELIIRDRVSDPKAARERLEEILAHEKPGA